MSNSGQLSTAWQAYRIAIHGTADLDRRREVLAAALIANAEEVSGQGSGRLIGLVSRLPQDERDRLLRSMGELDFAAASRLAEELISIDESVLSSPAIEPLHRVFREPVVPTRDRAKVSLSVDFGRSHRNCPGCDVDGHQVEFDTIGWQRAISKLIETRWIERVRFVDPGNGPRRATDELFRMFSIVKGMRDISVDYSTKLTLVTNDEELLGRVGTNELQWRSLARLVIPVDAGNVERVIHAAEHSGIGLWQSYDSAPELQFWTQTTPENAESAETIAEEVARFSNGGKIASWIWDVYEPAAVGHFGSSISVASPEAVRELPSRIRSSFFGTLTLPNSGGRDLEMVMRPSGSLWAVSGAAGPCTVDHIGDVSSPADGLARMTSHSAFHVARSGWGG